MKKMYLLFILVLFSINSAYAEPFSISSVQKTAGVPLSEMNYDLPYKDVITDYDYSNLNDKEKVILEDMINKVPLKITALKLETTTNYIKKLRGVVKKKLSSYLKGEKNGR